jgi:hypothetical protein
MADPQLIRPTRDTARLGRMSVRGLLVVALALAAAGCGSASGTSKVGASVVTPRTLNLSMPATNVGVGGQFTPGYTPGSTLFNPGSSFIIWNLLQGSGLQVIYCVVARQHPGQTFWCADTYVLPGGQIDAVGDYDNSIGGDAGTIAVVGGTGAYVGARGTATTINDDPNITIRLK